MNKKILRTWFFGVVVLLAHGPNLGMELKAAKEQAKIAAAITAKSSEELKEYQEKFTVLWNNTAIAACLACLNIDSKEKATSEIEHVMAEFIKPRDIFAVTDLPCLLDIELFESFRLESPLALKPHMIEAYTRLRPYFREEADLTGYTPLLSSVFQGELKMVEAFLKVGANLNATNKYGQTALMIADQQFKATGKEVFRSIKEIVNDAVAQREEKAERKQKLIKEREVLAFDGLKRHIKNNDFEILVLYMCRLNLSYVLPHIVNQRYGKGLTPLLQAARVGCCKKIIVMLIDHGARVDARNDEYHTPLMLAAMAGHVETVALLLEHMSPGQIRMTVQDKTAYDLVKEQTDKIERLFQQRSLPEYEQKLQKYKQIMMLLDVHNGFAAIADKQASEKPVSSAGVAAK